MKKEREEIQVKLDQDVKDVEDKHKEMKDHLEGLKTKQSEMSKRIDEINI